MAPQRVVGRSGGPDRTPGPSGSLGLSGREEMCSTVAWSKATWIHSSALSPILNESEFQAPEALVPLKSAGGEPRENRQGLTRASAEQIDYQGEGGDGPLVAAVRLGDRDLQYALLVTLGCLRARAVEEHEGPVGVGGRRR